jgi:hypothetical protein
MNKPGNDGGSLGEPRRLGGLNKPAGDGGLLESYYRCGQRGPWFPQIGLTRGMQGQSVIDAWAKLFLLDTTNYIFLGR